MTVFESIDSLVGYGLSTGLIEEDDIVYARNRILEVLKLDSYESKDAACSVPAVKTEELEQILKSLLDYAAVIFQKSTGSGVIKK